CAMAIFTLGGLTWTASLATVRPQTTSHQRKLIRQTCTTSSPLPRAVAVDMPCRPMAASGIGATALPERLVLVHSAGTIRLQSICCHPRVTFSHPLPVKPIVCTQSQHWRRCRSHLHLCSPLWA